MRVDARRYFIRGRVQGVGYRNFAQRIAGELGITGWAKNLDDGRVEVFAVGTEGALTEFGARLYQGPRWGEVRGVVEQEAAVQKLGSFSIR